MSNSDNILDRLRQNKQRSSVPSREDILVSSASLSEPNKDLNVDELKTKLAKFPPTRRRSGINLEEEIDEQLTQFCKEQKITVETFLEAAWEILSCDPVLKEKLVTVAKQHYHDRKEAGNLRRIISMLSNQNTKS